MLIRYLLFKLEMPQHDRMIDNDCQCVVRLLIKCIGIIHFPRLTPAKY